MDRTIKELEELVDRGAERNTVIYDRMADFYQLTPRLIAIMKAYVIKNNLGQLSDIYLRKGGTPEDFVYRQIRFHQFYPEDWSRLESYYFDFLKGSVHEADRNLIIGQTNEGNVILGSY